MALLLNYFAITLALLCITLAILWTYFGIVWHYFGINLRLLWHYFAITLALHLSLLSVSLSLSSSSYSSRPFTQPAPTSAKSTQFTESDALCYPTTSVVSTQITILMAVWSEVNQFAQPMPIAAMPCPA